MILCIEARELNVWEEVKTNDGIIEACFYIPLMNQIMPFSKSASDEKSTHMGHNAKKSLFLI